MHVSGGVSGIVSAQPHEDRAPARRLTQGSGSVVGIRRIENKSNVKFLCFMSREQEWGNVSAVALLWWFQEQRD